MRNLFYFCVFFLGVVSLGCSGVIAIGDSTFIVDTHGNLWACGSNHDGQLGFGHYQDQDTFQKVPLPSDAGSIIQIAGNSYANWFIDHQGRLWACGRQFRGASTVSPKHWGNIFSEIVELYGAKNFAQIAVGDEHILVLDKDGNLLARGDNGYGELGLGHYQFQYNFKILILPEELSSIRQIAVGDTYSLVLDGSGIVWACGFKIFDHMNLKNHFDQRTLHKLVLPEEATNIVQIITDSHNFTLIDKDGGVWASGYIREKFNKNNFKKIYLKKKIKVQQLAKGPRHEVVLTKDGQIWTCGSNFDGQLGLGTYQDQDTFQKVHLPKEAYAIVWVCVGHGNTFVLDEIGQVWACGDNKWGQLGIGNNENQNTFQKVLLPCEVKMP